MTHYLRREGHRVAFCTLDRPMRDLGMNGVRRGKGIRTTVRAKDGHRAGDLLNRDFTAPAPNTCWVADFTYCRTWAGLVYVAFIVDCSPSASSAGTPPPTDAPTSSSPRSGSHYGTATGKASPSPPAP
jgi:transposase InsO family protein